MRKRILLLLALTPLVLSCGGEKEKGGSTQDGKAILNVFINGGNAYDGIKKDSIWQKIEEDANVSLNVTGATHNSNYYTNLDQQLNTSEYPYDIFFYVPSSSKNAYNNYVEQDIVWNLDDLLAEKPDEYPYLETILHSDQFKYLTFGEGAHTLMPYFTSRSGWGIYYRADWLINIGYTKQVNGKTVARTPETIEEFQDVLQKFTENDPDGNGKNDTFGLSPGPSAFYQNPLFHAFGVSTDYDLDENNEPTYMYLTDEFKDYLAWMREMIAKGYVDKQFPTNSNYQDRDKFYEGTVGILITNAEQHVTWISDALYSSNPKASIAFGKAPVGTAKLGKEGAGGFSDWGGYWGGYSIHKSAADPHACMRFLNYLYSPEGTKTRFYGIKGTHWDYDTTTNEVVPNIEKRNEEPTDTFATCTIDGVSKPTGAYKFGSAWGGDIDWSDDKTSFKMHLEPKTLDANHAELISEAIDLTTLSTSRLTNVTCFYSSFNSKMKKVEDAAGTYAINAMLDTSKSIDSYYSDLMNQIEQTSYGWSLIKAMITEVARNIGIIS